MQGIFGFDLETMFLFVVWKKSSRGRV